MKQFGKIFKFEFNGYLKNKVFVGITIFLVVAIATDGCVKRSNILFDAHNVINFVWLHVKFSGNFFGGRLTV